VAKGIHILITRSYAIPEFMHASAEVWPLFLFSFLCVIAKSQKPFDPFPHCEALEAPATS
jgi:hypothetical protein